MSDNKRRLNRLEQEAERQEPELPILAVFADYDDPDLYRDKTGNEYTEADFAGLRERFTVIRVVYTNDWRQPGDDIGE